MVTLIAFWKLASPTNSPASPTRIEVSENHSAITNGYAIKVARTRTPGASSAEASSFSFSPKRVRRETRTRLPPAAGTCGIALSSGPGVDLAELGRRPFHRVLGLHL